MTRPCLTCLVVCLSVLATVPASAADTQTILESRAHRDLPGTPGPKATRDAVVVWSYQHSSFDHVRCVRGLHDVNGDGYGDALVAIDDASVSDDDLLCYSGHATGSPTEIWGFNSIRGVSGGSGYGDYCIRRAPDLNGDMVDDVLYGTAWGGRTAYALTHGGSEISYYDTYVSEPDSGWVYSMDTIGDVNGDDVPDIIAGAGSDCDAAWCLSGASTGSATVLWRYDAPDGVTSLAAIGDVNGDTIGDALFAAGDSGHQVVCVSGASSGTATILWTYSAASSVFEVSAIEDLSGDGVPDALVGLWSSTNNVVCVSGASSGAATTVWTATGVPDYVMELRPLQDVNADMYVDIMVASWDNRIAVISGNGGGEIWHTDTGTLNGGDVWTIAAIGDQNSDGFMDVLAGSFDQKVYCCDGVNGDILWDHSTSHRIYSVHAIPDVNGDGIDDALAGTQGSPGVVYCLSSFDPAITPSPTPTATGTATVPAPSMTPTPEPGTPTTPPTPFPYGVRLDLPAWVSPGETFSVTGTLMNPDAPVLDVPVFFMLDVNGEYWFWPDWAWYSPPASTDISYDVMEIPTGFTPVTVLPEFVWPETGSQTMTGLYFHGALLNQAMDAIEGEWDSVMWGFGPR